MSKIGENQEAKPHSSKANSLETEQLQDYLNLLKERTQYYQEENTQMEEIFKKLKILSNEMKLIGLGSSMDELDKIMASIEMKNMDINKTELGYAEKLRKHSNYVSKLKICSRHYINLNESISKQIKSYKCELENSKHHVNNVLKLHSQDIQLLEEKAKKYENELVKFEKKYPWLQKRDFDLPNIAKQIEFLKSLKEQKEELLKELDVYKNLKPDIKEAKQQLADLKEEMKSAMVNLKV